QPSESFAADSSCLWVTARGGASCNPSLRTDASGEASTSGSRAAKGAGGALGESRRRDRTCLVVSRPDEAPQLVDLRRRGPPQRALKVAQGNRVGSQSLGDRRDIQA